MLNIFKREFKFNLKGLLIFSLIMSSFMAIVVLMYESMTKDGAVNFNDLLANYPIEILRAFNMDIFDLSSAFGFAQSEGYVFWLLVGGVYFCMLGSTILNKEENDGTIEYLYSRPVKRRDIIIGKYAVGVVFSVLFNAIIFVIMILSLLIANESFDLALAVKMSLTPIFLFIILFSISFLISSLIKRSNLTRNIGLGMAFGFYLMQLLGGLTKDLEFLLKISPYEFISARYLVENGGIKLSYLIVGIVLIIGCFTGALIRYNKKELC